MVGGRWLNRGVLDHGLLVPPQWLGSEMRNITGHNMGKDRRVRISQFTALSDSLEAVKPSEKISYERVLRLLADELGALRSTLTPKQQARFDPFARTWMRQRARLGDQVPVPGVAPAPD
jgi:hypothetical protein